MAVPSPPSRSQAPRRANAVAPVRAFYLARGLLPVTPRATLTPLSAGRLRMTSAI